MVWVGAQPQLQDEPAAVEVSQVSQFGGPSENVGVTTLDTQSLSDEEQMDLLSVAADLDLGEQAELGRKTSVGHMEKKEANVSRT